MRARIAAALFLLSSSAQLAAEPDLATATRRAAEILPRIGAAIAPLPTNQEDAARLSLGANLVDYSNHTGGNPAEFESFIAASRRILNDGDTAKTPPDATSRWLDEKADAILATVQAVETQAGANGSRDSQLEATLTDLRLHAQLARFHARRAIAAVHYNLFKRGQRLAELLAATLTEREAVAAWRELVRIAEARPPPAGTSPARKLELRGRWREELVKLEGWLKVLEEQCCPPDEAILKEKVWTPPLR